MAMVRHGILFTLILFLLAPAAGFAQVEERGSQWIFHDRQGDGSLRPSAIFLSWNYAGVIFRATCQADKYGNDGKPGNGGITLHSYPEPYILETDKNGEYLPAEFPPYTITRGAKSLTAETTVYGSSVRGDIPVMPELLEILKPAQADLEIYVKSEMDEPIYVGQAEPLYRLAKLCQTGFIIK